MTTITHTDPLIRFLLDRLADAFDHRDGDGAVSILRQIHDLDPTLGSELLDGLVALGLSRLRDRIADATRRGDRPAVLDALALVCTVDPDLASDLMTHLREGTSR
jgi:hypothetical protein